MNTIIEIAAKEIGTKEFPENSNKVKYNTWLYNKEVSGSSYPWCGAFVSWVFDQAKKNLGTIDYTRGFAGTNYAMNNVHKWGKIVSEKEVKPGYVVFFDWDKNKRYDHTGIFEKDNGDGQTFTCIEGNTSLANDSNGGSVMRRQRRYSVAVFVKPNVLNVLT